MEKTRQALEKLALRVAAGRLKKAQNIGAAAARILSRNHGASGASIPRSSPCTPRA
jgi:hypothetical protein